MTQSAMQIALVPLMDPPLPDQSKMGSKTRSYQHNTSVIYFIFFYPFSLPLRCTYVPNINKYVSQIYSTAGYLGLVCPSDDNTCFPYSCNIHWTKFVSGEPGSCTSVGNGNYAFFLYSSGIHIAFLPFATFPFLLLLLYQRKRCSP